MFQNSDPRLPNIFPGIAKKKGKVYATKKISVSAYDKAFMRPIRGIFSVSQSYPCVLPLIKFYS